MLHRLYYIRKSIFKMNSTTIDDAINNTIAALRSCVNDDPVIGRFIILIDAEFSNIKPVIFQPSSRLPVIINSVCSLYETLDKAVIILRHIDNFKSYASTYKINDSKSIDLCLKFLETQYHTIVTTIEEIKIRVKS